MRHPCLIKTKTDVLSVLPYHLAMLWKFTWNRATSIDFKNDTQPYKKSCRYQQNGGIDLLLEPLISDIIFVTIDSDVKFSLKINPKRGS